MKHALELVMAGFVAAIVASSPARAHPHVWVTVKSELVYAPDGSVASIRHVWTFDDMYSAYALQSIEHKTKDVFTREELAPLAEANIASLKDYDYFNHARVDGDKRADVFTDPVDYWFDYTDSALTLHFTLPLKTPTRARNFEIKLYDPEFFIDFDFAENEPVSLVNAPTQCALTMEKPTEINFQSSQRLNRSFQPPEDSAGMGSHFASKILVTCP
jgi:ABC-type uncharacterized transport system substrate-binding protein